MIKGRRTLGKETKELGPAGLKFSRELIRFASFKGCSGLKIKTKWKAINKANKEAIGGSEAVTVALISELGRKQKVRVDWTHLWKGTTNIC